MKVLFKNNLYSFLKLIPSGKVVTYKTISDIFGLNSRYIANVLSKNKDINKYPCYKVVKNNGYLSGYNQGQESKIKKIQNDGIKINDGYIDQSFFRKPKLKNYFVAFPIEGKEKKKFQSLINDIKTNFDDAGKIISFQKDYTPHLTLKFFGNMYPYQIYELVYCLKTEKYNFNIFKDKNIVLDSFGNFGKKIYFFQPSSEKNKNILNDYYKTFHKITGFENDIRPFYPHFTVFRIKKELSMKVYKKIEKLVLNYNFSINLNKLRLYVSIDNHNQTPIVDFDLD